MLYRVAATSLNLRSEPKVSATNRVAVLPNGQKVEKIADSSVPGWWQVCTVLNGATLTGYVSSAYLAPAAEFEEPAAVRGVTAVHLEENRRSVTRASTSGRAFPLGEPGRPGRGSSGSEAKKVAGLLRIVDYLNVEKHARYRPGNGSTYCNIYAYDYCYLSGVYLPRVWWTQRAVSGLAKGKAVPARYGETLMELNANALYDWLREYGSTFGWTRAVNEDEIQQAANRGCVGVICAQRTDLNRSGHISVVVPENPPHACVRDDNGVQRPLQSQAGATNFCFSPGRTKWWTGAQFRAFGFWIHP